MYQVKAIKPFSIHVIDTISQVFNEGDIAEVDPDTAEKLVLTGLGELVTELTSVIIRGEHMTIPKKKADELIEQGFAELNPPV